MTARTPEAVHTLWVAAVNAGDIEQLMPLYEAGATVVFGPGRVATGLAAIRAGNEALLALRPRFDLAVAQVLRADNLALLLSPWTMTGAMPDGTPVSLRGTTSDVVRQQPDGTWRFIIDNPTGSDSVGEMPQ